MYKPMPDHLIFPLESFTSYAARTTSNRTEIQAILGVDIGIRAVDRLVSKDINPVARE